MKTMKYKVITLIVVLLVSLGIDIATKRWALQHRKGRPTMTALPGVLELGFTENRGMIFGILNNRMPQAGRFILTGLRLTILVALSVFIGLNLSRSWFFLTPFLLFWAGAIGNLIDPFLYGYVVDFIHIHVGTVLDWPFFFNIADAYVTIGMVLLLFNGSLRDPARTPAANDPGSTA